MSELLLPPALLGQVTPEALERMAEAVGLVRAESWRYCVDWDVPNGEAYTLKTPMTTKIADYLQVVHSATQDLARITKIAPVDVLRDLLGRPVSIPAQGWRVPRECDYGRTDLVLEAHRFPGVTGWSVYRPDDGVGRASNGGEVMIHDIAELPTT